MEILKIVAPILALLFTLWMGVTYVLGAKKDGKFTGDEMAKVAAIGGFLFMLIVNGYREPESPLIFDHTMVMVSLGSVLILAGIDVAKLTNAFSPKKKDDNDK